MKESQLTEHLIFPRYIGWLLRLVLTFFAADTFGLDVSSTWLVPFLIFELFYLVISHHLLLKPKKNNEHLFLLLILDNSFWIIWLSLTGGATNAFISSLLIPIAIASIALPIRNAVMLSVINCVSYSVMLYFEQQSGHMAHMNMDAHYFGMWFNFILSASVINISLSLISQKLRSRDKQISMLRETQLKHEQLVSLGASSAQMAHQLATPLCTMRLWLDELKDNYSEQAVEELNSNLSRCEDSLNDLRLATDAIRDGKKSKLIALSFIHEIERKTQLLLPEAIVNWSLNNIDEQIICVDQGVLPAIITLIDNAQKASFQTTKQPKVEVMVIAHEDTLQITIRDFGAGIDESVRPYLGKRFLPSENGLGVALTLTHASLERNDGLLTLQQHEENGCIACVKLPITSNRA